MTQITTALMECVRVFAIIGFVIAAYAKAIRRMLADNGLEAPLSNGGVEY